MKPSHWCQANYHLQNRPENTEFSSAEDKNYLKQLEVESDIWDSSTCFKKERSWCHGAEHVEYLSLSAQLHNADLISHTYIKTSVPSFRGVLAPLVWQLGFPGSYRFSQ